MLFFFRLVLLLCPHKHHTATTAEASARNSSINTQAPSQEHQALHCTVYGDYLSLPKSVQAKNEAVRWPAAAAPDRAEQQSLQAAHNLYIVRHIVYAVWGITAVHENLYYI